MGWQGCYPCLLQFDVPNYPHNKGVVTLPLTLN